MTWPSSTDDGQPSWLRRRSLLLVALGSGAVTLLVQRLAGGSATGTAGGPATGAATTGGATGTAANVGAGAGAGAQMGTGTGTQAGAGTAAGTGAGTAASTAASPAATETVLATVAQIPVGGGVLFPAQEVLVTRPAANTLNAFSSVCTHTGCIVNRIQAQKIFCPCHRGVYNLDGTVASGPPPAPLQPAPNVQLRGNNIVIVT